MRLIEPTTRKLSISLTPLIDVVFILLLFFMLSTQFSRQQVVELTVLPDGASSSLDNQSVLRVHLSADGVIRLDDQPLSSMSALIEHPDVLTAIADSTPIQLDADDDVSLQQVISASDSLSQAGADTLDLSAFR